MRKFILMSLILLAAAVFGFAQAPKEKWAKFGAHKIRYYDIGESKNKNALVFIHGWTGNADLWSGSYSAFPNHRVIALDLIGHGKSDKPKTDYTMDLFARSVEAVLKKAKVDKAVLVGHSMGWPISRQFYRLYPNKVSGIVNVDGPFRGFPDKGQYMAFLTGLRSDYKKTAGGFLGSMLTMKDEKLKESIVMTHQMTPDYVAISAMAAFDNDDLWKTDPVKVPVMGIFAESPWWPADTESAHRAIAPDLEFHMWKGPTHFLMMEKTGEFNELIRSFIVKHKLV